ncbi:hypothetical protein Afil01_37050 [Actinorhabdospora filicis]|uniref:3-methyladenine DNA glycosylase AlkD n=1 Tax=Actinorhabdospora filicis TaxID=1785913 RepID=A0A9W6SMV8_9ACTN|nr:DNA alkylation repair protein [Actinorhabdospora filicis]GLZ78898.1 hypothetical protein Afil01_37050 [Actinorhabdospora filicis]
MDNPPTTALADRLRTAFEAEADTARAAAMAAYMRDLFPFLGLPTPIRRSASRPLLAETKSWPEAGLAALARACWALPEREYQYFATDVLVKRARALSPAFVPVLHELVTAKSWWDTVDALASRVAGPLVAAHPELAAVMDEWIGEEDFWLARIAILHQLTYKGDTDTARLFAYCERRKGDTEFFIRKAIGWALREYAKTDPDAVREYVKRANLPGLSRREALKNIGE